MAVIYDRVYCITHISFYQAGGRTFWKLSLLTDWLLLGQQGFSSRTPSASIGSEFRWPFRFTTLLLPCKSGFATALGISSVSVHRINSLSADTLTFIRTCSMNTYMYLRTWLTCLTGWFQPNFSGLSITVLSLTRKALWCQQPASPALRVKRVVLWAGGNSTLGRVTLHCSELTVIVVFPLQASDRAHMFQCPSAPGILKQRKAERKASESHHACQGLWFAVEVTRERGCMSNTVQAKM